MTIKQMIRQIYWAEWHEFHIDQQKQVDIMPRLPNLLDWLYEQIDEEAFPYWDSSSEECQEYAQSYGVAYKPGEVFYRDNENELIADTTTAWGWWQNKYEMRQQGMMSYDYRQEIKDGIIHSILGTLNKELQSVAK